MKKIIALIVCFIVFVILLIPKNIVNNEKEENFIEIEENINSSISSVNSNSSLTNETLDDSEDISNEPIEWNEIIIDGEVLNREKAIEELNNIYIGHNSYQAGLEEVLSVKEMQTIVGFDEAAIAITEDKYINTLTVDDKDFLLKKYVNSEGKFYYLYNDILIVPIRIFYGKSENEIWLEYEFSAQTLSTPYFRESKCQETNCRVRANGKIDTSYVI